MHRLFVALRPPEEVRDALIDTMEALDGARWQDDEQLHLTLRFVGEVDARAADDLVQTLARVPMRTFDIELDGIGHFERKGTPKAIWARIRPSPALLGLRGSVERACIAAGQRAETRAFLPHVTIARLGRGTGPIGPWLARHGILRAGWRATGFSLFESHLGQAGATYEEIVHYPAEDAEPDLPDMD